MRIASTGNVGIGTTGPTNNLHIYGSAPGQYIQDSGAPRCCSRHTVQVMGLWEWNQTIR